MINTVNPFNQKFNQSLTISSNPKADAVMEP
jgi:hypothetical protein